MEIERVTVYRVNGRDFDTLKKAGAHIDDLAAEIIKRAAMAKDFALSETIRLTDAILSVRADLAPLMTIELPYTNELDD